MTVRRPVCTCGDTLGAVDPWCGVHFPSRNERLYTKQEVERRELEARLGQIEFIRPHYPLDVCSPPKDIREMLDGGIKEIRCQLDALRKPEGGGK